jgi:5-methylcytosine-specific restriction endonuclease McrA
MFNYCVERLGMSEGAAYRRIRVARLSREFPEVLDALAGGRVHLVGLQLLAPHMTRANVDGVLARASGKSKREIEVLIRELAPKPDVPTTISRVRAKQAAQVSRPSASRELFPETVEPAKPVKVQPLAPERYHVSFTASEALKNKLERAKELAGHGARVEDLIEDAMELLVAELEKKKLGVAGRKAGKVANRRGRYIAKAVARTVHDRDGGQCTFRDESGRRCSERTGLHFDHVVPHALGGESTVDNLRLRCGPHNQLHAEQCFGPLFVERRRAREAANQRNSRLGQPAQLETRLAGATRDPASRQK